MNERPQASHDAVNAERLTRNRRPAPRASPVSSATALGRQTPQRTASPGTHTRGHGATFPDGLPGSQVGLPPPTSSCPRGGQAQPRHTPCATRPRAPPRPGPAPPAASGTFIGSARPRRWEVGAAAAARLPAARPPARASDAGAAAVSASTMRPGTPGPLWPLPWGALAWAVGFVGSVGSGDPAPGEWGGRKGRAGWATHVGLPGMRALGEMLGALWPWELVISGLLRLIPGGLGAPLPQPQRARRRVTRRSAEQM